MILKRTIRRNGTDSLSWFLNQITDALEEMVLECGVTMLKKISYTGNIYQHNVHLNYIEGVPRSLGIIQQYRYNSGYNNDYIYDLFFGIAVSIDGVNILCGGNDSYQLCSLNEFTDMCKADYYNSKDTGKESNFLGGYAGVNESGIFNTNSEIYLTVYRNAETKTFGVIMKSNKSSHVGGCCHTSLQNFGPVANNGNLCLPLVNGTPSSRKDYGVSEEHFRMINPIGFYGGEAFDFMDNIDKINGKAYIQKPLVAMYKRGIIGEVQGLYYSTIKAPAIGTLVSMGGISYLYIGSGLYFKEV